MLDSMNLESVLTKSGSNPTDKCRKVAVLTCSLFMICIRAASCIRWSGGSTWVILNQSKLPQRQSQILLACDSCNSSSISLSPITWEQCTIHDYRRVHMIHVVEKNIMTSTGCRGCSTLEKSQGFKRNFWQSTDTQHHSLAFRKDAFPSNVSLSSLTFKASQCVTWWHQNCMKQLILVSDSISRYSNVGQVERLRIFGSFGSCPVHHHIWPLDPWVCKDRTSNKTNVTSPS